MALIGPDMPNIVPPVYAYGYSDQPEDLGSDGYVPIPDKPGLGVVYYWDFIVSNLTAHHDLLTSTTSLSVQQADEPLGYQRKHQGKRA